MKRPFYTQFAWAYDLLIQGPVASRVAFVIRQLQMRGILPGARLLDAGCGTGSYSIALAERGFAVIGLDAEGDMIDEARKKVGLANNPRFIVGSILNLPDSLQVDAILCRGVLNDLTDEESRRGAFGSFSNALNLGGVLFLDVREWNSTVTRKTNAPVFEKTIDTERGRLTFRSVAELEPERHCLLVSESHLLESCGGQERAEYGFVMRCWTQHEVTACLTAAGFESVVSFSDYVTAARTSFRWFRQDIVPQMNKVFANTSFQIIERFGCSNLLSEFKKLCKEVFSWERGIYAKRQWIVSYTEKALRVFADCCIARLVGFANGLIVTALEMKAGLRAKPGSRCTPPRERAVMLSSEL